MEAANKQIEGHSLIVSNKDIEIPKLREELKESKDRDLDTVAEYQKSMDFLTRYVHEVCKACRSWPGWFKVEEAHGCWDYELPVKGEILEFEVTKADIANADPCVEFEEEGDLEAVNTDAVNDGQLGEVLILDAPGKEL